jgi:hypothetical protein
MPLSDSPATIGSDSGHPLSRSTPEGAPVVSEHIPAGRGPGVAEGFGSGVSLAAV